MTMDTDTKKLLERLHRLNLMWPIDVKPLKKGWSAVVCEKYATIRHIPSSARTAAGQRCIIQRFLEFYESGKLLKNGIKNQDVVLAAIALVQKDGARNSEDLIWKESDYGADDTDDAIFTVATEIHPHSAEEDFEALFAMPSSSRMQDTSPLKRFIQSCHEILQRNRASEPVKPEVLELYKLCNFLAMTMLSGTIKSDAQMHRIFASQQYKQTIKNLTSGNLAEVYAPPSQECLKQVPYAVHKQLQPVKTMFAKLLLFWSKEDEYVSNPHAHIYHSFLKHTEWNGMGIVEMLFKICDFYGVNWEYIRDYNNDGLINHSWKRITDFISEYQVNGEGDKTVRWARLVNDAYFSDLSTMKNVNLASVLLESADYAQGNTGGIKEAHWVKKNHIVVNRNRSSSEILKNKLIGESKRLK